MDFLVQDLIGFFKDPKNTFKRMSTYESIKLPAVLLFISGVLMAIKKCLVAGHHMKDKAIIMPYDLGLRDANYVMAFLTPFVVIACWYICSFVVNEVAEKLGALKGEFPEILMASGYLAYPILAFQIITFLLFYFGEVAGSKFFSVINTICEIMFILWMLYLMTQLVEILCEVPFSIALMSLLITFIGFAVLYYGVLEMVLNRMILVNFFQGRHLNM